MPGLTQWFTQHPFSTALLIGVAGSLIAWAIIRLFTKSEAPLAATPAPNNSSTSQSNITLNFAQPVAPAVPDPTSPAPSPPQPKPLPNIVFKKGYANTAWHVTPGIWSGISSGKNADVLALLVEFQNAATVERHVGGQVHAFIEITSVPDGGITALRGCWLEEKGSYADFPVDTIHRLLVAAMLERGEIVAVAKTNNWRMGEIPTEAIIVDGEGPWHVQIRLTDANQGHILYEGTFHMTADPPAITQAPPLVT